MLTQTIVVLLSATLLVDRVLLAPQVEIRRQVFVVGHQGDDHGLNTSVLLDLFGDLADDFGDFEFGNRGSAALSLLFFRLVFFRRDGGTHR